MLKFKNIKCERNYEKIFGHIAKAYCKLNCSETLKILFNKHMHNKLVLKECTSL